MTLFIFIRNLINLESFADIFFCRVMNSFYFELKEFKIKSSSPDNLVGFCSICSNDTTRSVVTCQIFGQIERSLGKENPN